MKNKTLLLANFKRHKGTMFGIGIIMLTVALSLMSVISIWLNSNVYLDEEMNRMTYGDITAWTQSMSNEERLYSEIEQLNDVDTFTVQPLIYADYEILDQHSDSEGQLVVYEPDKFAYRIFNEDHDGYKKEDIKILNGEIYVSPTLLSTFDAKVGDWITFPMGRQGKGKTFQIKGTFEDPFMGSSMIGMKSFLIAQEDYDEMKEMLDGLGIDALARTGQMLHIKQSAQSTLNNAQFNQLLNEQTSIGEHVEFIHSKDAIFGFMLILQNAFAGLSLAFALILLLVSVILVSYSIGSTLDQDERNIGILKTVGYEGEKLRTLLKLQYLIVISTGFIMGILLSIAAVPFISERMVLFAGILTPSTPHMALWICSLLAITGFFYFFLHIKTRQIKSIPPMHIIQGTIFEKNASYVSLQKHFLMVRIAIRQLLSGKKRYISVCMTAILLVFITSMIGRMNAWLGPDGKGMMDAFNPADLDIGVQLLGKQNTEEMEQIIQQYSNISDSYELAMSSVSLNGIDVTGNVIDEPKRFHIRQGVTSYSADEIVITETIATDMNLNIGDQVTLSYNGKDATYSVSGIYQCANDMGGNIGMSKEGFLRIGEETQDMWCHHYFLEEPEQKQTIMNALDTRYGGDVYIHENTWPGLFSIIAAMQTLLFIMYILTAFFIIIVTMMTGHKIFLFEKRNLSIYKAIGFTSTQLRYTFAIRYGITAAIGSMVGILLSAACTDRIVGTLMNWYGISNFASHPTFLAIMLPGFIVSLLFAWFAYLTSNNITKLDMNELVSE